MTGGHFFHFEVLPPDRRLPCLPHLGVDARGFHA